jgi:hypothetical protein
MPNPAGPGRPNLGAGSMRIMELPPIATERGPNSGQFSGGPVGLAKLEIWRT